MIEVGAAAGLLLAWHRYRYDYGEGRVFGPHDAGLTIGTSLDPHRVTPVELLEREHDVVSATGIDPNPLDPRSDEDVAWLQALVWPDQRDRSERLARAIEVVRESPPSLLRGDASGLLVSAIAQAPADAALIVFHSHTLNQFAPPARQQFDALVTLGSVGRRLYRVSQESLTSGPALIELRTYSDGLLLSREHLADAHPHGDWVRWSGPER